MAVGAGKEKEALAAKDNKENRERSEERLSGAKQDLFELLERVQCSRIDDQRCVLPSKLSQVGIFNWEYEKIGLNCSLEEKARVKS